MVVLQKGVFNIRLGLIEAESSSVVGNKRNIVVDVEVRNTIKRFIEENQVSNFCIVA